MPQFSGGFALCVGVGGNLPGTVKDAAAIAELLSDATRCAYPPDQVQLVTGEEATRDGVLAALDSLASQSNARNDATVVVYFSGHASPEHALITSGATSITSDELGDKLRAFHARKLLLLLDCCFAAGIWDPAEKGDERAPLTMETIERLREGQGHVVLSSSRQSEKSYAGGRHSLSVFTRALMEALTGMGAAREDGFVRVTDLIHRVDLRVPELTKDHVRVQHPVASFANADNFKVAFYGAGDAAVKSPPASLLTAPESGDAISERIVDYPPGPRVPAEWSTHAIIRECSALYASRERAEELRVTAVERLMAEDSRATFVPTGHLPDIALAGAEVYWSRMFDEAKRHGPRMVAALLLSLDEQRLEAPARTQRTALLKRLREPR
jgi:hypothetical protein